MDTVDIMEKISTHAKPTQGRIRETVTAEKNKMSESAMKALKLANSAEDFIRFCSRVSHNVDFWQDASAVHQIDLRSSSYMKDAKKARGGHALSSLVAFFLFRVPKGQDRIDHATIKCPQLQQFVAQVEKLTRDRRKENEPALMIINWQIPGTPAVSMIMVFALLNVIGERSASTSSIDSLWEEFYDDLPIQASQSQQSQAPTSSSSFSSSMSSFSSSFSSSTSSPSEDSGVRRRMQRKESDDVLSPRSHFRNQRFKIVPRIVDGPWVVRKTVPSGKPALLGKKLKQRYFRGECYVETCVHVGSSPTARAVTKLCRSMSQKIVVEIGITLEAVRQEELPERLIGAARLTRVDFSNARPMNARDERVEECSRVGNDRSASSLVVLEDANIPLERSRRGSLSTSNFTGPRRKYALDAVEEVAATARSLSPGDTRSAASFDSFDSFASCQIRNGSTLRNQRSAMSHDNIERIIPPIEESNSSSTLSHVPKSPRTAIRARVKQRKRAETSQNMGNSDESERSSAFSRKKRFRNRRQKRGGVSERILPAKTKGPVASPCTPDLPPPPPPPARSRAHAAAAAASPPASRAAGMAF